MDYTKNRVTFITGALTGGGAERVLSVLANSCVELGAQVTVIVLREKEETYSLSPKIKCYRIKEDHSKFRVLERIFKLRRIIKETDCGTLISFMPLISLYTLVANIGIGKRMIMSERADPNVSIFSSNFGMKDRVASVLMRNMEWFGYADVMVFQTPDARNWYSERIRKKSFIIPNPLDSDKLPLRFEGVRRKAIVAAGRFSAEKNFELLINGFAKFSKRYPDYCLELYGEGGLRTKYQKLIKELDIAEKVVMPGFVSDLPQRMNDAAMYISTSNHEGISNSMLEALGMGVPTIVTDCPVGGARMFVHTDENGVLIRMNDLCALVEAMEHIARDKEFSDSISKKATVLRKELDAKEICKRWLENA